jgi:mRNA-degrading endonuclease toxin of MazEF toxin-antitoxin module
MRSKGSIHSNIEGKIKMQTTTISPRVEIETQFTEQRQARENVIARTEVLDKAKEILLIPKMKCLTTNMVADYFGVDVEVIQKCYQRNKEEIDSDGVKVRDYKDFMLGLNIQPKQLPGRGAGYEFDLSNGIKFVIPRGFGVKTFTKRAVLRVAMLLRDSEVAKQIRTHLLNVFEGEESNLTKSVLKYRCGSVWFWYKNENNPQSGRPVFLVSDYNGEDGFATLTVLTITTTTRGWDSETPIVTKDGVQSYIQCDSIYTVPLREIGAYFGDANIETIFEVKTKLTKKLGLTENEMKKLYRIMHLEKKYGGS